MIKLIDVHKTYRMGSNTFEALKGINIDIAQGEFVGIVGPSGSGKSTTMNIMGLLDKPTTGEYFLNQMNVNQLSRDELAANRNRSLGFIFQHFYLLPKLTALENVMLPLTYRRDDAMSSKQMKLRAMHLLERVSMQTHANHRPHELSGGQQQRVAIARALINEPHIILADEPTGALDTQTSAQIIALLKEMKQINNTTIVIITHDLELASQCERSIHIRDGLIQEN